MMFCRIKNNLRFIFNKFTLVVSVVFALISGIQLFIDWDNIGINDIKNKIAILLGILIICAIISIILGMLFANKITIYSKDDVEIEVRYGDLMKIAFPKKQKKEKIVVIAVNCCFDTIVNQDIIFEGSVHGQFLKRYVHNEAERASLEANIKKSLSDFGYKPVRLKRSDKRYGNLDRYPLGSIARINGENGVTFFLLALTECDKDCKAHCNKHQYVECMLKLFEYYDSHGQGMEMYLYPMGTGMARTGLSKKEALEATLMLTELSKEHLKSKTTIVVDKRSKNEISITDL